MSETIGLTTQLQLIIPSPLETDWATSIRNNCFQKIVEHDHTGVSGKGIKLATAAITDDAITGAKIRLDNNEYLKARNAANSANKSILKVNASDEVEFGTTVGVIDLQDDGLTISDNADNTKKIALNASNITTGTTRTLSAPDATGTIVLNDNTATLTNKTIDADSNTITNIENADIKAAAAIAVDKLAAVTASRAVVSDGSGFISAATTTATEIGYVNGVTSAIQTQLNAKAPSASPTFSGTVTTPVTASRALVTGASNELAASATTATEIGYVSGVTSAIQTQLNAKLPTTITTTGDIIYSSSGTTASRLAIGSAGEVLTVSGGLPSWEPVTISPTAVTQQTTTYTALTSDSHIECTSGTFTVTLYAVASNSGRRLRISNTGTGVITVDPNSTETFNDGTTAKYLSQDQFLEIECNGTEWIICGFNTLFGVLKEIQTSGTDGGSSAANNTQQRTLNTTEGDFTKFGSLSSSKFTLEPGTYYLKARAPAYISERHQLLLYNFTTVAYESVEGDSCYSGSAADGIVVTHAQLNIRLNITTSTEYGLVQYTAVARASDGLGIDSDGTNNPNTTCVYSVVEITKVI